MRSSSISPVECPGPTPRASRRSTVVAVIAFVIAACSPRAPAGDAGPVPDAPAAQRPNIVFVLTDDLNVEVYGHMMRLKQLMDDQGISFRRQFLNISLCCPSRTAILRGQYAHNTKIFSNAPPTGGFETFFANHSEMDTLPVWLSQAGYRTVLMGKYLNGYPNTAPTDYIPPGWTEWYSPVSGTPYSDYNYTMNENGREVAYAMAPTDYMPDVLAAKSVNFIQRATADHVPFFMYVAPFVPHAPATPAPRYAADFPGAQAPRTASFNQADVSRMPPWVQALPLLTAKQIGNIDALYRKRLQSMEAIEDLVQGIVDTLQQTGALDHTYIVFTSDNGFHQGQHRLVSGKNTEFDEDLFVPLIVRGPGIPAGATSDAPTLNVDFAPTFLELAGVDIPAGVDGRSFASLLSGAPPAAGAWRDVVLLQHAADVPDDEGMAARPASLWSTLEPPDAPDDDALGPAAPVFSPPPFDGVRTTKYTYVEYATGDKALYDHDADPDQLDDLAPSADPALLSQLAGAVHAMHGCSGAACRTAEQATVP